MIYLALGIHRFIYLVTFAVYPDITLIRVSHRCCEHGGGGAPQNLMGGRGGGWLESKHGESMGELKMLSKNTCERVHLMKKLLAISLQASKFTKNELFNTSFSKVLATFSVII